MEEKPANGPTRKKELIVANESAKGLKKTDKRSRLLKGAAIAALGLGLSLGGKQLADSNYAAGYRAGNFTGGINRATPTVSVTTSKGPILLERDNFTVLEAVANAHQVPVSAVLERFAQPPVPRRLSTLALQDSSAIRNWALETGVAEAIRELRTSTHPMTREAVEKFLRLSRALKKSP